MTSSEHSYQIELVEAAIDLAMFWMQPKIAARVPANSRDLPGLVREWAEIFATRNRDREWGGDYLEVIGTFFDEQYHHWLAGNPQTRLNEGYG